MSKTASALRGANPYLLLTLSALQLAGVAVSFAGVLAILAHGRLAVLAFLQFNVGDLFLILAMGMWSVYTIGITSRLGRRSATLPAGID